MNRSKDHLKVKLKEFSQSIGRKIASPQIFAEDSETAYNFHCVFTYS